MEDVVEALRDHGSQLATHDVDIAVLKDQNRQAEGLNEKLLENDVELQVGQARLETKLDAALGNGHGKSQLRGTSVQAGGEGRRAPRGGGEPEPQRWHWHSASRPDPMVPWPSSPECGVPRWLR